MLLMSYTCPKSVKDKACALALLFTLISRAPKIGPSLCWVSAAVFRLLSLMLNFKGPSPAAFFNVKTNAETLDRCRLEPKRKFQICCGYIKISSNASILQSLKSTTTAVIKYLKAPATFVDCNLLLAHLADIRGIYRALLGYVFLTYVFGRY